MKLSYRLVGLLLISCMSIAAVDWQLAYPEHFPAPVYDFSRNELSVEKIQLGRALFYDPVLSRDSTISCASCHSPFNAFAHTDHDLSHGIDDQIGTRNAPALFNLAWQSVFMWDGAINHLDVQALAPISHPDEMDESLVNVLTKLQGSEIYPSLFNQAFSDSLITGEHLLKAIAQFQLSLVSAGSKYDDVQLGEAAFTEQEEKGYALFIQHCNSCHAEPLFSTYGFANNGLPVDTLLQDFGKEFPLGSSIDSLQFKIPSLRNLSFSHPYMHDGRFKRLSQVLNHYSEVRNSSNQSFSPDIAKIELSPENKADIISFLLTLDDRDFVFAPNHRFPREIFFPVEGK